MNRTPHQFLGVESADALLGDKNLSGKVMEVKTGYHAGVARAQELREGDVFLGAMPEADARFARDSASWHAFVIGFVSHMPRMVVTNPDGVLLEYR